MKKKCMLDKWKYLLHKWIMWIIQIGRVIETLKRIGEFDNTLIMVTADNGASGEGGLAGTFNETYVSQRHANPIRCQYAQL